MRPDVALKLVKELVQKAFRNTLVVREYRPGRLVIEIREPQNQNAYAGRGY